MRLIDSDRYKKEIMDIMACWNISPCLFSDEQRKSVGNLKVALKIIDEVPTAFDLESVIEELNERAIHAEQKAAEYDESGNTEMMDIWDTEAKAYRNSIEILKSAANATNGKNGG